MLDLPSPWKTATPDAHRICFPTASCHCSHVVSYQSFLDHVLKIEPILYNPILLVLIPLSSTAHITTQHNLQLISSLSLLSSPQKLKFYKGNVFYWFGSVVLYLRSGKVLVLEEILHKFTSHLSLDSLK